MSAPKPIIVCGATGKQGKSVITNILASPSAKDFHLLALTRDANSASAKSLAAKSPSITLLQGNQDNPTQIFDTALTLTNGTPIWGVFSVQVPMGSGQTPQTEETQGKAMVHAALAHNVKHFVYSSVDRGGDTVSDTNPTPIPHFRSKHRIEQTLKEATGNGTKGMSYTILRPVAFMDGFTPDFMGKVLATWIKISLSPQKPLAFVAVKDIGFFGAKAFIDPQNVEFHNNAISLAGDELTVGQLNGVFREKVGYEAPRTFELLAWVLKWMLGDLGTMLNWFESDGYGFDAARLRRLNPGMMDLGTWLEREGGFEKR